MNATNLRLIVLLSAIVAAAALRLVSHPPNLTPIGAMALFSGAYLGRRWLAFAAPLGAMLLSDLMLGFHSSMLFVYVAVALIVLVGWAVRARIAPLTVLGGALAGSVVFFALTNYGVWLLSGMYPLDLTGLAASYVAAIPFFQNTLTGDLLFSALLFGGFALLERQVPALRAPDLRSA